MAKQSRRKHRLLSPFNTEKKPIETLEVSEPFFPQRAHGRTIVYDTRTLYCVTKERHRDGRVRTVLRGRDMRRINKFEAWKERESARRQTVHAT